MTEFFQAIILGLVQGFTEFLPISSSAHLYLIPYLFKWDYQGLGFDVALHWGTLLAVIVYFYHDYWNYLKGFFVSFGPRRDLTILDQRLGWYLVLGSLPVAIAGFLAKDFIEGSLRNPIVSVVTLSLFALVLWVVDNNSKKISTMEALTVKNVLFIGLGQAVALIPGVSRSGATITAGLFLGLSRNAASRFAFLLSGPAIFGAGLVAFGDVQQVTWVIIFGFLSSAIAGFIAIRFLLKYISTKSFKVFVWYRLVFAGVILLTIIFRA